MIDAQTFIKRFEQYCPLDLAEEGDPVGLHIGTLNKSVKKIMMTLDVRPDVVQEAINENVDLIIAKHPPIFRPVKRLTTDHFQTKMYADLLANDIAVYAAHTNMDIINPGLNDWFCEMLGVTPSDYLRETHKIKYKKLVLFVPTEARETVRSALHNIGVGEYSDDYDSCSFSVSGIGRFRPKNNANPTVGKMDWVTEVPEERIEFVFKESLRDKVIQTIYDTHPYEEPAFDIFPLENISESFGIGRIGRLANPMPLSEFTQVVKETFKLDGLRLIANSDDVMIEKVAICGGSGEKFYHDALKKGADVYITGDVYYHTAHDMLEDQLPVIDPGHYIEEVCKSRFVDLFNEWKKEEKWDVEFIESKVNTNPFKFI
ncbi:Nif3-like dinuclear metal center hexameric protein [Vagococcus silagei]|uniref:GTP cyclohydrolase 1 type 2 homolog n=1 Tax=Vagococcus silagei TaxID=2508885 RepID=A0A4S3B6T9_9ENTE|nr:Nif3-like dinuclear metal center hexameric protein [Vagococcus silagei]THB61503.1 Nif3-like dinuclear metal center hexameric protein [Vagococcus silagei]